MRLGTAFEAKSVFGGRGRNAGWGKAPWVLANHPGVLVAVFVAALLAGLASSSAPFVTTAAASEALKDRLSELTSFATGVEVLATQQLSGTETAAQLDSKRTAVDGAAQGLRRGFGNVASPVVTTQTESVSLGPSVEIAGPGGNTAVVLMARTGALSHVTVLRQVAGPGVWVSDITAQASGVRPGDMVRVEGVEASGRPVTPQVRVKGIYRALAHEPETDYWTNLFQEIYPQCLDCNVPPSFVFLPPGELSRVVAGSHLTVESTVELPIQPAGLTLQGAQKLTGEFASLRRRLDSSPVGRALGCSRALLAASCTLISSLSAAVILANENASAVTPAVTLLSDLGTGIALAVAAAAGTFLVRRRRAEAALAFARGEHVGVFAARSGLEVALPSIVGGAAGLGTAYTLTSVFTPAGSISPGTVWSAVGHAAVVVAIAVCLLVAAAAISFLSLYDTGWRGLRWLGFFPWELIVGVGAVYLLLRIRSGGGISTSSSGAHAPTLAVFVYPLLAVAAVAGLSARGARMLLRRGRGRGEGLSPPVYLALRRLAAARGLVVVLAVVGAVSLGSLVYVETLAGSLDQTTREKAYMGTGSDASAIVTSGQVIPRSFPYPVTLVQFSNQTASLPDGTSIDVMLVDPSSLTRTLHWQSDWGPSPRRFLAQLAAAPSRPLPVIVSSDLARTSAIELSGVRVPVRKLAVVSAFPFMAQGIPLVITSSRALNAFQARTKTYDSLGVVTTYAWANGPPAAAARALDALDPAFPPQTIDTFLHDPEVVLATRTFRYMRLIAIASGALAIVGLGLYLQARQRAQVIASALAQRMGFSQTAQALSLGLELVALLGFSGVVGGAVAVAAAVPIVHRIDPLPIDPPGPIFVVPIGELAFAAAALLAAAVLLAAATSWRAAHTDPTEALRVA